MSNPKLKNENYSNFGGINTKMSPYLTSPLEFLDLYNFDFQTPGSLSPRWGSTQYIGQTFSGKITSLYEFTKINGFSQIAIGSTGALWVGSSSGLQNGISLSGVGITLPLSSFIYSPSIFQKTFGYTTAGGGGFVEIGDGTGSISPTVLWDGNYGLRVQANLFINPESFSAEPVSFATYADYLFLANGSAFAKYDGATLYRSGVPIVSLLDVGVVQGNTSNMPTKNSQFVRATGSYIFYASYVNNRGVEGKISPIFSINANADAASLAASGGTYIYPTAQIYVPDSFGISSINIYSYWSGSTLLAGSTAAWTYPYVLQQNYPIASLLPSGGGTSFTFNVQLGSTIGGYTLIIGNQGPQPSDPTNSYFWLGTTFIVTNSTDYANVKTVSNVNYNPKYLEVYQNRMFISGFSASPNIVWFSDINEPERYEADFNFEVRTNNGDYITAMKTYLTNLCIFKQHSFHVLSGDSPDNFFLRQISDQYGCVNNRSHANFNNLMMFLDQKGLIIFNGANIEFASTKIQSVFDSMNYAAAVTSACMVHDNLRNQILCAIPVNGATINNLTVVYDYVANAWTKYDNFSPSVFSTIQGRNQTKNAFYGSYSGVINWFGASFNSDNGVGFSTVLKTRFLHDMGESVQKQFRWLFLNIDAPGSTLSYGVKFYQDFGASVVLSTSIVISQFQQRLDYGISAKSLAFELSNISTSSVLRLHGFTIASRFQRNV